MRNFREIVASRLKESGLSRAAMEGSGALPPDAIRNVLTGRSPRYDNPMPNFREIVAGRLKQFGLSTAAVERSGALPPDAIRNVLRGRSPRYDQIVKICETLNLELIIRPRPEPGPEQETPGPTERAKAAVRAVYCTDLPRQDIVDQLRRMPKNIIAAVIDDMVGSEEHEDAEELRSMARQAGHTIW